MFNDRVSIARLWLKASNPDPLTAQLRLARLLSAAQLCPAGLGPSAILCIRKLRDPLPGTLQLHSGGARPPPEWEQAVTAALDRLIRSAARPAFGPAPSGAEAVLFADQAELLACLARDWAAGSVSAHWWWKGLFPNIDPANLLMTVWRDAPEYIPAALAQLAEQGKAAPFIRALSLGEARLLTQIILRRFGLQALQSVVEEIVNTDRHTASSEAQSIQLPNITVGQRVPSASGANVETADGEGLTLAHQCLLGIGLMLHRAPAVVRAPSFARQVHEWHRAVYTSASRATAPDQSLERFTRPGRAAVGEEAPPQARWSKSAVESLSIPQPAGSERLPAPFADSILNAVREGLTSPVPHSMEIHRTVVGEEGTPQARGSKPAVENSPIHPPAGSERPPTPLAGPLLNSPHEASTSPVPHSMETRRTVEAVSPAEAEWQVETKLGGIFYLINVGLFLTLYGDFTAPAEPGLSLSIWDFVALLGTQLMGEAITADPVWPLLARLAGRGESEEPGWNFEPPDRWRLPPEWLMPFPEEGVWRWSVGGGRLRLKHPQGFWVLDLPLEAGDPQAQRTRETQPYAGIINFDLQPDSLPGEFGAEMTLERWLGWLVPYVRVRLQRAFGLTDAGDIPRLLCKQHAHLRLTATQLDVFLSLAELPIQIRLAGLDRDPGWVPAAGRFIAFHFE